MNTIGREREREKKQKGEGGRERKKKKREEREGKQMDINKAVIILLQRFVLHFMGGRERGKEIWIEVYKKRDRERLS